MKVLCFRAITRSMILGVFLLSGCTNSGSSFFQVNSTETNNLAKQDGYGAIAFSATTQRWHIRWNVSDQARADVLAAQYCGVEDCAVVLRYGPGQCGTFSLGNDGALATGLGGTEDDAASAALAACRLSGQSCKVAPVRCNDQS